jgi:hypothetical protein
MIVGVVGDAIVVHFTTYVSVVYRLEASQAIPCGLLNPVTPILLTVPVENGILFIALFPLSTIYNVAPVGSVHNPVILLNLAFADVEVEPAIGTFPLIRSLDPANMLKALVEVICRITESVPT